MLTLPHLTMHYSVAIIDLWGVIHDGTALYPKAKETLHNLRKSGISIALLSNAPRRASKARDVLRTLGIEDTMYDMLLTSGEEAFLQLSNDNSWLGTRYYYLGPGKDEDVLTDAPAYTRVDNPAEADFVLNTGFEVDFQPQDAIMPTLQHLLAYNLPLLCINPDREVVKLDGTHMLCAGVVAGMYEALGGRVHRIGKPYLAVYERIMHALNITDTSRVLAFGDSAATDILGANRAGIDSVLITGGILAVSHPNISDEKARSECAAYGAEPTFILPHFAL
jgi:HAD superfamily hydrolase (TIGR01459 family)